MIVPGLQTPQATSPITQNPGPDNLLMAATIMQDHARQQNGQAGTQVAQADPAELMKQRLNQLIYDRSLSKKSGNYSDESYARVNAQIRLLREQLKGTSKE